MAQKNIDFGSFPDDPSADAIRTAFQKVQENFDEIYSGMASQTVQSVNQTPGAGISVNNSTGNVVVSANIACVQVQSSTLGLGIGGGPATSNYVVLTSGATPLTIEIPANIENIQAVTVYDTVTANTVVANLSVTTPNLFVNNTASLNNVSVSGSLTVARNANVGNLRAANGSFAGNVSAVNFTGTGANLTGNIVAANANLGNAVRANYFIGDGRFLTNIVSAPSSSLVNGSSSVNIDPNGNVRTSVAGNANVLVVTPEGANTNGYVTATGNVTGNIVIASTQLVSRVSSGTAPLSVSSNTVVPNLNAELLNGFRASSSVSPNTVPVRDVNGNVAANYFIGNGSMLTGIAGGANIANGLSNVNIPGIDSNVTISVANVPNVVVVSSNNVNVKGSITATNVLANAANITNVTANSVNASQSVTAPQLISNVGEGSPPLLVTSRSLVINLNSDLLQGYSPQQSPAPNSIATRDQSGNIAANYFIGNGSMLTGLPGGSSITNGNSNVNIPVANGNILFTSQGVANVLVVSNTGIAVSGNVTNANVITANSFVGNLQGQFANGNSNVNIPSANGNVNISASGNANVLTVSGAGANVTGTLGVSSNANIAGSLAVSGNANLLANLAVGGNLFANGYAEFQNDLRVKGNLSVDNTLVANGNITGANLMGPLANGSSNVNIPSADGNVTISVAGTSNVVSVSSNNVRFGSGTGGNITGANVIEANTFIASSFSGDGSSLSNITLGNINGIGNLASLNLDGSSSNVLYGNGVFAPVSGGNGGGNGTAIVNGTSNVSITDPNGNVTVGVDGTGNVMSISSNGVSVSGLLSATSLSGDGNQLSNISAANVVGLGNISAINLNGNANSVLLGNGAWGPGFTDAPSNGLYYARRNGAWVSFQPANGSDGTGALQLIYSSTTTVPQSSLDVYSIPNGYNDLIIVISGQASTDNSLMYMYVNNDTSTNYEYQVWNAYTNVLETSTATPVIGTLEGPQGSLNATPFEITILNYSNDSQNKRAFSTSSYAEGTPGNENFFREEVSWAWKSNAVINQLTFSLQGAVFEAGTTIRVYGRGGVADGGHGASGVDWINPPYYSTETAAIANGAFNYTAFATNAGMQWFNGTHAFEAWRTDSGGTGENRMCFVGKDYPAGDQVAATMGIQPNIIGSNDYYKSGLTILESATNKSMGIYMDTNGGSPVITVMYFPALDQAPQIITTIPDVDFNSTIWFRVIYDRQAQTYTFFLSLSFGDYWLQIGDPIDATAYFAADYVGLGMQSFGLVDPEYFRADVSYYVDPQYIFYGGLNPNVISNGTSNVYIPQANGNIRMGVSGTPDVFVLSNVDGKMTGNLLVTGNLAGNITDYNNSNVVVISSNSGAGRVNVAASNTNFSGNVNITNNANVTGNLVVTGNITAGKFIGNGALLTGLPGSGFISNGTANVSVPQLDGNVVIQSGANAGILMTAGKGGVAITSGDSNVVSGTISASSQNRVELTGKHGIALLTTSTAVSGDISISAVGNLTLTAGQHTEFSVGAYANINGNVRVSGQFSVPYQDAFFDRNVHVTGNLYADTIGGTIAATANAQPNITSVSDSFDHLTFVENGSITMSGANSNISGANLVTANYFSGDGHLLTNISVQGGTYIQNGNSNIFVDTDSNVRFSVAGVPNVFVVGDTNSSLTTNLAISGTANIGAGANVAGDITLTGNLTANSGTGYIFGNAAFMTGMPGGAFIANGGSNVNIAQLDGTILLTSANGNIEMVTSNAESLIKFTVGPNNVLNISNSNANIDGQLLVSKNANFAGEANVVGNLSVGGNISASAISTTGNVTANKFVGDGGLLTNLSIGSGTFIASGNSNVAIVGTDGGISLYANSDGIIANAAQGGDITLVTQDKSGGPERGNIQFTSANGNIRSNTANGDISSTAKGSISLTAQGTGSGEGNITQTASSQITLTAPTANINANTTINNKLTVWGDINAVGGGSVSASYLYGNLNKLVFGSSTVEIPVADGGINIRSALSGNISIIAQGSGANTGNISITSSAGTMNLRSAGAMTISTTGLPCVAASMSFVTANANFQVTAGGVANVFVIANVANVTETTVKGNLVSDFFKGDGRYLTNLTVQGGTYIASGLSNVYIDNPNGNVVLSPAIDSDISLLATGSADNKGNIILNTSNGYVGVSVQGVSNVALFQQNGVTVTSLTATNEIDAPVISGSLKTTAQPNIRSVGTLIGLTVGNLTSNIVFGNGTINATGTANISGNIDALANVNVTGNVVVANGGYFVGDARYLTNIPVTTVSNIQNGNTSVEAEANANVLINVSGTPNVVVVTSSGANITGTLNVSANANVANLGVTGNLLVTGNANVGNITANIGNFVTVAGTLSTPLQTSITRVGTLGLLNVAGAANLGSVSNVTITGGSNGQYLRTDGAGNLSWQTINTASISNGTSNINVTSSGGNVTTSVAGNANVFVVSGTGVNVAGTLNATGDTVIGGNANVSGTLTANGNITAPFFIGSGANLTGVTATSLSNGNSSIGFTGANGNISLNPAGISGLVTVSPANTVISAGNLIVTNGNITANGSLTTTGNLVAGSGSGGTISGANLVSANLLQGTLITGSQPNINSLGTLNSLTVANNITVQNGYTIRSVNASVAANGNSQTDATPITSEVSVVSVVNTGQGVVLPTAVPGMILTIVNPTANALLVYPAANAAINALSINAAFSLNSANTRQFVATSTTQWYNIGMP